jgi:hypothetical protein
MKGLIQSLFGKIILRLEHRERARNPENQIIL